MAKHHEIDWEDWDDVHYEEKFECPECGGFTWGEGPSPEYYKDPDNFDIMEDRRGHCHNEVMKYDPKINAWHPIGCKFTWKRSEDHKVFVRVKKCRAKDWFK